VPVSRPLRLILDRLREFREEAGITTTDLEKELILGPGWVRSFEAGGAVPSVDTLLAILHAVGRTPAELFGGVEAGAEPGTVERSLFAESAGDDLVLHFDYADFDASYFLRDASLEEFEEVLRVLRDGLAGSGQKSDAIMAAFRGAIDSWPQANPSDIWWFLVQRAYLDPFNHPASEARRDFEQSWKRAGGWALERILVAHYGPFLARHGVSIAIPKGEEKKKLLGQVDIPSRLEIDKVDVVLSGRDGADAEPRCFGAVHVKASFAERRTDDVELSRALVQAGYCSPFWTMDCKSTPGVAPVNKGELGELLDEAGDARSAKRKDFEVDGFFSGCFSYNAATKPTPAAQKDVAAAIHVCDFSDPDDDFSRFIRRAWDAFRKR
jgi:transcriptional regulator with XRE-family HTH domain